MKERVGSGANIEGIYRLSSTQEGLLFHTLYAPDAGAYIVQFVCRLTGELDVARFRLAWQQTVERHDAMRALFTWEGREQPLQIVRKQVRLPFSVHDWRDLADRAQALESFLERDRAEGFRLESAPLMRLTLFQLGPRDHWLVWSFHHLILDGWSQRLVWSEVLERFRSSGLEEAPELPPAPRFGDYIAWLGRQDVAAANAFWKTRLAGFRHATDLRLPRPSNDGVAGHAVHRTRLSAPLGSRLDAAARGHRVTLSSLFRAAWAVLLARYSGEEDVVFGATVSGRSPGVAGVEAMVGLLINTLPIRVRVDEASHLGPWLRTLQQEQLEQSPYEFMSLADVQRVSDVPRGQALAETIVVFQNVPPGKPRESALEASEERYVEHSHFPLALLVLPEERIELTLIYDRKRFAAANIERLAAHLETILETISCEAEISLADIELLSKEERETLLADWGRTEPARAQGTTVVELFERAAAEHADAQAVADDVGSLSYRELQRASCALAQRLVSLLDDTGHPVAICLEPSRAMAIGILGILYAGRAYVPIDPRWPPERIDFILADTGAAGMVTTTDLRDVLAERCAAIVCADEDPGGSREVELPAVAPNRSAYVMYTSGSTGRPKGAEITHESLVRSTEARFEFYPEPVETFLLLSSFVFDSSIAGIFWTLCQGGTLMLPPSRAEQDVDMLARRIAQERVTHTLCLPSVHALLLELAEPAALATLRVVIVAGEACPAEVAARHGTRLPGVALYNEYGPTEATVWSVAHRAQPNETGATVPIGRPIPGARVFVVDRSLKLVPVGVPGELLLGGPGLARGYLHQPRLTEERFVHFRSGGEAIRVYRTGDLVRWREDGALEFLGRVDNQVKIRGYRIELEEIEAVMSGHRHIERCAVIATSSIEDHHRDPDETAALARRLRSLGETKADRLLSDIENASATAEGPRTS